MSSGLYNVIDFNVLFWRFLTVTPLLVTSAGNRPCAEATRFCTFTTAISASVPCLKYMVIDAVPVFVAVEVIYIMSSTPLSDSSSGTMTLFITVSALAPVYDA